MASEPTWTVSDFVHTGSWWKNRGILVLNIWLLLPLFAAIVNGLDSSMMNGLQIIPAWQMYYNYPTGGVLGVINAAQSIGCVIGLPFSPYISDKFGRRSTLLFGSLVILGGVALQTQASTVHAFIGARIMLGAGLINCINAGPLLLIELAYPTQRGKITSMYNSLWYLGSIISSWVCFGAINDAPNSLWSFRVPTMVQAIIPLLQVSLIWFIPESPRYLVSKGFEGKAAAVLGKYHGNGVERVPLVVFELAQIRHAIRMEEETNTSSSYIALFNTRGNRRRMRIIIAIAVFSQWSGNGLVSYYINLVLEGVGVKHSRTKAIINGGLQIYNFIVAMGASMLVDWVGRRRLFIISNTGMLVTFSSWTIAIAVYNNLHIPAAATAAIPLIFIFNFFYDIAYTPLLVSYTLESLPYRIRAKGFAVMNLTAMLTVAFNQFINPVAIEAIGWWYYIVYCAWLAIELIFVVNYVVETKGRTLEETAALFDGDQQPQDLIAMGGDAATQTMINRPIGSLGLRMRPQKETSELYEMKTRPWSKSQSADLSLDEILTSRDKEYHVPREW